MPSHHDEIETFFKEYEQASNAGDTIRVLAQFADPFIVVSAQGTQPILASDFAVILPKRKAIFEAMGCRSASLHSLRVTPVNKQYALADTKWNMHFTLADERIDEVVVGSTFLVRINGGPLKIVLYLPHEDIMEILRERGILPKTSS